MTDSSEHASLSRRQFTVRALVGGLSVAALPSLLAACSSDSGTATSTSSGPVNLTFWKYSEPREDAQLATALKEWNSKNPSTQVQLETFEFNAYLSSKLPTAFAAGHGPDIFWISPGNFIDYVNNGIAGVVDSIVNKADFAPASVAAVSVDGKMHALPFQIEPVGLFYREDHLQAAGIQPPQNWDDFRAAAKELTQKNRKGVYIEPGPGPYQNFTWYPFLWSAGGEVVNPDSTASALRTPEAALAYQLWGDLVRDGSAPKKVAGDTGDIAALGRGDCSMQICGIWAVSALHDNFSKVPVKIIPLPAPAGRSPKSVYGGFTQMVNDKGPHVQQALEFTQWLWIKNKKFPVDYACNKGSELSPQPTINKACSSVFATGLYSVMVNDLMPIARAEPRYPDQIVKAVGDGLQAAMFAGKSGEEAASLAADSIDRYLSTYKGAPLNVVS